MVENRKWFYAISLLLLTCCQITTMFPHNAGISSESNSNSENNNNHANWHSNSNQNMNSNNNYKRNNNNADDDDDSDFLIVAAERMPQQHPIVFNMGIWENQDNDSTPAGNIDDLIFLDKRPINQQQHQQQRQEQLHQHHQQQQQQNEQHNNNFEFHHVTMDEEGNIDEDDVDTESMPATTYSTMIVNDDGEDKNDDADDNDGGPHEIELQPDINEEVSLLPYVTPLDLSDFLSLIPALKVKTIVNHYYHNDPEVQRAHAFMSSRDFCLLKQHFIAVPEMSAFLRYLNKSGLDLVKFVTALTNLTSFKGDADGNTQIKTIHGDNAVLSVMTTDSEIVQGTETNDIEYAQKQSNGIMATISNIEIQTETGTTITTATATTTTGTAKLPPLSNTAFATTTTTMATIDVVETTTAKEQLNGLHGLVDSILDVLPQDQILATFFDKLEANEQFSKLVDSIGCPEFAKILNNMQNSISLRNLIFTLHNNGIYVIRIVDSLKSYFFLGGF